MVLTFCINRLPDSQEFPSHHVLAPKPGTTWGSYVPHWDAQSLSDSVRTGFRNPWQSWHKPSLAQVWTGLEWGQDADPCIDLAAERATLTLTETVEPYEDGDDSLDLEERTTSLISATTSTQAAQILGVTQPDFSFDPTKEKAKTTWLGHAGVLIQLSTAAKKPLRILFDPIFSARCSPTQYAGPIRSYASPCTIEALPPIDLVIVSHNHYDHLDYPTIRTLWALNSSHLQFLVPLGNKSWFHSDESALSIPSDRVIELDWWESVTCSSLSITATPAQHGSGRYGVDANCALWSSWFLNSEGYKVFFGGDTGFQFHNAPFPPAPPSQTPPPDEFELCPAFQQIAEKLGSPHLLLLPVSVGATLSFLRSYVPLPDSFSPMPRLGTGLTASNHMPPWDAVRVFKLMAGSKPCIALAIHWGTFVSGPSEVLKTLGQLEWACNSQNVKFARSLQGKEEGQTFIALNHGESIIT